jgi:hypothetical protein
LNIHSSQKHFSLILFYTIIMRTTLIVSAFSALAVAAPRPQDIEFDQVDAAPDAVIVAPPSDVTTDSVPAQPVAEAVAIASSAVTETTTTEKRDFFRSRRRPQ